MKFPIRLRLALASCAVFLVVIAALELVAYVSVRAAIHSIVDHELETRLAGLDDHLTRHIMRIPWPQLGESLKVHPAFQPDLLRIQVAGGELLLDGNSMRGISIPTPASGVSIQTEGNGARTLRVLTVRRKIDGRTYDLALATDLFFPAKILGRLWLLMLVSLPLVLLISAGAGYWISARAISPVSDIIAAARSIDSNHLSQRISVPCTSDEIQQLAETMNGMLTRIEDGFQQVRQFIANASHELRTPLAIIRANAEVALLDGGDRSGRSSREALHRILREAERDTALLEDMLHLARIDAGTLQDRSQRKPIDLHASLAVACADIRPLAESRGLTLRVNPRRGSCLVDANEEQLRRLWLILLDNAVKYTSPGGTVSTGVGATPDGRPFVFVADTGVGIAPEHRTRIFERFYRIDKSRSRNGSGTGLGLSIAHQVAASHGATIELRSEPGEGSRFSVIFPAEASVSTANALAEAGRIFR